MVLADFLSNFDIPGWLFWGLIGLLVVLIGIFFVVKNKKKDD